MMRNDYWNEMYNSQATKDSMKSILLRIECDDGAFLTYVVGFWTIEKKNEQNPEKNYRK